MFGCKLIYFIGSWSRQENLIEPVPAIGVYDRQGKLRYLILAKMLCHGLISGIIRFTFYRQGFCKLQGGSFGPGVPGTFAPGGQTMKTLLRFASVNSVLVMHIQTKSAAVDLGHAICQQMK